MGEVTCLFTRLTVDRTQKVRGVSVHLLLQRTADVRADGARKDSRQEVDEPSHAAVGNG